MKAKLTKRAVEALRPTSKDVILWDAVLPGFHCKVTPRGHRRYFLYYRTSGGRERRPKIGDHGVITCDAARDIARKWLRDIAGGEDPSAKRKEHRNSESLEDFAKRYMAEYAIGKKKESSLDTDRINLRCHILPAMGRIKISDVTRADVIRLYQSMKKTPGAANRTLALVSHMLNVAEKWGLRPDGSNPCRHVDKYPSRKRERYLSGREMAALGDALTVAEKNKTELLSVISAIRLLILTGCRLSEILTLKWDYVDFEKSCLRLPDSKTGAKIIYLPAPALEVLARINQMEGNPWVIVGQKPESHLVNLQKPWRRIRKVAGLEDVRLHDLRHTFASVGTSVNLSLPLIGKLLGHTQARTTERYAHLQDDPVKQAAEKIGAIISASLGDGFADEKVVDLPARLKGISGNG